MNLIEPISRKLMHSGRAYLNVLSERMEHLEINRYYYALTVICQHDGELTQKALSELLDKDKSLIVTIIDTLSEQGFVYREINPADRREHLICATDKARKAVPHIIKAFEETNKRITEDISAEEMAVFDKVLNKMHHNLKQLSPEKITV